MTMHNNDGYRASAQRHKIMVETTKWTKHRVAPVLQVAWCTCGASSKQGSPADIRQWEYTHNNDNKDNKHEH